MKSSATKHLFPHNGNGSYIVAAIVILFLCLLLGGRYLNHLPENVHAWSQSDWYSIAIGFQNNGYDFFHPETLIYNKQYPGWWMVDYGDTITSVDFPLHEYIIALLMGLLGTSAPWVFRLWTLLCSLAGLWFLYLLARRLTGDTLRPLFILLLAATSPLYAYYFANYLPSAPALALIMAGLWAYTEYWHNGRPRYWYFSVALLTLGALTRTSQLVPLVAVFCFELLRIIRKESPLRGKVVTVVASMLLIGGYWMWNMQLRAQHGAMFLSELNPLTAGDNMRLVREAVDNLWRYVYFSRLQQWVLLLLVASTVVVAVLKRRSGPTESVPRLSLWWLLAIWFFGEVLFCIAMGGQFAAHDYYFLDSLFLPVILLATLCLKTLPMPRKPWRLVSVALLVLLGIAMTVNACKKNIDRHTQEQRATGCNANYSGADIWLDNMGVSRDAKILSVFSYPQNTPFIQMGRKGYSLMWFDEDIVDSAMCFPFDYIVVEDDAFRDNFNWQSRLLGRLVRIGGNGRLSLCRLADSIVNKNADIFFISPGYVGIEDGHFVVDGETWFPMMLNYKAFVRRNSVVPASWQTGGNMREHFDTIAAWGFNSVRLCIDAIGDTVSPADTAAMFAATRRTVLQADSAGLRVMLLIRPPFKGFWRDYATGLMRHLADLPAVWAYDLMNEPLYFDPEPSRDKMDAVQEVYQWRALVRENAPHQLFTVATAEPIEVFEWDPSMLPVDFIEMHTYHPLRVQAEMWWYSHYCHKPWIVGETSLPADGDRVSYRDQMAFLWETYRYARINGAAGYGWWAFQDCPGGANFEAQFTGLRDRDGKAKPTAAFVRGIESICLGAGIDADRRPPANYYNMLAYENVAATGRIVDGEGHPIEGAVVRGWNEDWSVGMNTFSDSLGRFRLVSNDICTHFEISASGCSRVKFDTRLRYPSVTHLPNSTREYQQIPVLGWGDSESVLPVDPKRFEAPTAVEASLGVIKLKRLQ